MSVLTLPCLIRESLNRRPGYDRATTLLTWRCLCQLFLIEKKKNWKRNRLSPFRIRPTLVKRCCAFVVITLLRIPPFSSPKFKRNLPLKSLSFSDSSSFLAGIPFSASSSFERYHTSLLLRVCALKSFGFV